MPTLRHAPVKIPATDSAAPLSAQQKKFNRHVERIDALRQLLATWNEAIDAYRARHAREFQPLLQQHIALQAQLLQHLDQASDGKLTKAERRTLSALITERIDALIDSAPDEATRAVFEAIYNRHHSGDNVSAVAPESQELAREMAQAIAQNVFGVELDLQDANMDTPEDFFTRLNERLQAQQEQEQARRDAQRTARQSSKRERKEREEAAQATQSVREIYRKLASALHPDRETDSTERARKTALMQRVNQAYAANQLLELLQLQLEVEQIDRAHIAGLSEERLKHYNRVLAEQRAGLEQELSRTEEQLVFEFGLEPWARLKPADLQRELRAQLQSITYENAMLHQQLQRLRADPAALKPWIKTERQRQKVRDAEAAWR